MGYIISKNYGFILLLCLGVIPNIAQAQFATFETDTSRFKNWKSFGDSAIPRYVSEMSWTINGQKMYFGSGKIRIPINDKTLDTLLFNQSPTRVTDTIIFNAALQKKYSLEFNDCCGGFNINPKGSRQYINGNLIFNLKNSDSSAQYFATLGEAGMMINLQRKDTLKVGCRSAMSPNI